MGVGNTYIIMDVLTLGGRVNYEYVNPSINAEGFEDEFALDMDGHKFSFEFALGFKFL